MIAVLLLLDCTGKLASPSARRAHLHVLAGDRAGEGLAGLKIISEDMY